MWGQLKLIFNTNYQIHMHSTMMPMLSTSYLCRAEYIGLVIILVHFGLCSCSTTMRITTVRVFRVQSLMQTFKRAFSICELYGISSDENNYTLNIPKYYGQWISWYPLFYSGHHTLAIEAKKVYYVATSQPPIPNHVQRSPAKIV